MTLHNIPEGLAVGVAFAGASNGNYLSAIILAIGIGIQNFPEGTAIALPMLQCGKSRFQAMMYGQFSALVEVPAALIGFIFASITNVTLPFILSFAAGAMFFVCIEELIPEIDVFDKNGELNTSWFLLPEGIDSVTGAPDSAYMMTWQDRQNIMVSSASTMALINAMGALDRVPMTTSDTTWRIREIRDAIDGGSIKEVGKYSAPDYEQILTIGAEKHVTFAVFSTMIDYEPDVYERLTETCGLRIMRDQSSSEGHPLARTEWIKIYGEIFDMREESDAVFDEQVKVLNETTAKINIPEAERKTVLIFYTTSSKDTFYVRNAADYVTELVNLAGGKQVTTIGEGKSGNTKMTQEEFIEACSEADYVLYNWTSGASGVVHETPEGVIAARPCGLFKEF